MKAETKHNFANRGFLTFKNLTLVPYQRRMIDPKMLSADDVAYLVSVDNNALLPAAAVLGCVLLPIFLIKVQNVEISFTL